MSGLTRILNFPLQVGVAAYVCFEYNNVLSMSHPLYHARPQVLDTVGPRNAAAHPVPKTQAGLSSKADVTGKKRRPLSANANQSKQKRNDDSDTISARIGTLTRNNSQPANATPMLLEGTRLPDKVCTDLLQYLESRATKPARAQKLLAPSLNDQPADSLWGPPPQHHFARPFVLPDANRPAPAAEPRASRPAAAAAAAGSAAAQSESAPAAI